MSDTVTIRDPKGRQSMDLFAAVYDGANLRESEAQRLNEHPEFVARLRTLVLECSIPVLKVLNRADPFVVMNHKKFIFGPLGVVQQPSDELELEKSFVTHILPAAHAVTKFLPFALAAADIPHPMFDRDVRDDLPEGHVFSADEFLFVLCRLTSKQLDGGVGDLVVSGHTNIFYVRGLKDEVFSVRLNWSAGRDLWRLCAWRCDESMWNDLKDRVFFRR